MSAMEIRQIGEINEVAARFYRDQLLSPKHQGPCDYLRSRHFEALLGDTEWTVGYAPAGWTSLHTHLKDLGYSDEAMLTAGLIAISRRGTPIDLFRDRITFGIRDQDQRLVGFTARAAPGASETTPKYLNTPSTAAYDKSSVFFGLGEAHAAPDAVAVVVTEGPLDALAAAHAGNGRWSSVALCGTALSERHAQQLAQLTPPTLLAFDHDAAGQRALERATGTIHAIQGEPLVIRLFAGRDPADLFKRFGPEALDHALTSAAPATDLVVTHILEKWGISGPDPHGAFLCLREASATLSRLGTPDVARHAARLSEALSIEPRRVTDALVAAAAPASVRQDSARAPTVLSGPTIGSRKP